MPRVSLRQKLLCDLELCLLLVYPRPPRNPHSWPCRHGGSSLGHRPQDLHNRSHCGINV
jgi:hypothetical protein